MDKELAEFLDQRFGVVYGRLDGIDGRLDRLETRMDGLETRMDSLETRMDGLETRMDGLEGRLDSVEGRLDGGEKQHEKLLLLLDLRFEKIDMQFEKMSARFEQRMNRLEERVDKVEERLDGMDRHFVEVDQRFERLETDIRHTNVLLEDIRGRGQTLAEGLHDVRLDLARFRKEARHDHKELHALLNHSYNHLDERLKATQHKVVNLDQRVGVLEASRN